MCVYVCMCFVSYLIQWNGKRKTWRKEKMTLCRVLLFEQPRDTLSYNKKKKKKKKKREKKRKKRKNMYRIEGLTAHGYERCFDFVLGTRNAVKLAASAGNPSAAVAASAHPPVLWSSRRKPGKSICIRVLFPTRIFISHPCLMAKLNAKRTFASPARFLAKVQLLRAGGSKLLLLGEQQEESVLTLSRSKCQM